MAPTPWTRFFFPEDLNRAGSGQGSTPKNANPMFQHFDVLAVAPLAEKTFLSSDKVHQQLVSGPPCSQNVVRTKAGPKHVFVKWGSQLGLRVSQIRLPTRFVPQARCDLDTGLTVT